MPPTVEKRCITDSGSVRSKAPNIDAAMRGEDDADADDDHLLARIAPKRPPVSAAMTSIGVKRATMPSTKLVERSIAWARDFASRAPKTLTVMAIIGYTQGVSETSRPPPSAPRRAEEGPFLIARVKRSSSAARAIAGSSITARNEKANAIAACARAKRGARRCRGIRPVAHERDGSKGRGRRGARSRSRQSRARSARRYGRERAALQPSVRDESVRCATSISPSSAIIIAARPPRVRVRKLSR